MSIRRLATIGLLCLAFLMIAMPVGAHTALESSAPADGATVDEPVRRVVLTFPVPIDLAGDGAQLLDSTGTPVDTDITVNRKQVVIRPGEPLSGGAHGVRWAVRSADGHPVRGTVRFTVDAPAANTQAGPDAAADAGQDHTAAVEHTTTDTALRRVLASDSARPLEIMDTGLRAVFYAVALSAMGGATFLLGAWDGPRRELRLLCRVIVRLALATVVVVVAQALVRAALVDGTWHTVVGNLPQTITPRYATGLGLRLAGAFLLITGTPVVRRHMLASKPMAGAAVDARPRLAVDLPPAASPTRGRLGPGSVMLVGVVAIAASFALVGHAATTEPRLVSATAAVAHVLAAAVWGGGLLALVIVLTHRRRRPVARGAGLVAVRYSVLATGGVLLAAAAGIALAVVRLDAVADLWTTAYGLALLAKAAVVAVVATIGAYNHFVIIPVLRRTPDHTGAQRLRRLILMEVGILIITVALTSVMVTLAG